MKKGSLALAALVCATTLTAYANDGLDEALSYVEGQENASFPWTYIAAADYGIRDDGMGDGAFLSTRGGGRHSGIDYLMPVGTPLHAPCDGKYLSGYDSGYGYWVQIVCPVPVKLIEDESFFSSILYAHLNTVALGNSGSLSKGTRIGTSGRSGNANSSGINPHLHFEIVVRDTEQQALNEMHQKGDEAPKGRIAAFFSKLKSTCMAPLGFSSDRSVQLGNRVDPFVFLSCITADKPALRTPQSQRLVKWSHHYNAKAFDVDVGQTAK